MSSDNNSQHSAPGTNPGSNGSATSDGGTAKNGNGRKLPTGTIPLVEPKDAASAKPRDTVTAKSEASSSPAEPRGEARTADAPPEVGAWRSEGRFRRNAETDIGCRLLLVKNNDDPGQAGLGSLG